MKKAAIIFSIISSLVLLYFAFKLHLVNRQLHQVLESHKSEEFEKQK